jgi:hypothetical protein
VAEHYEVRHRALREAGSTDGHWETSDVDGCRIQDIGRGNMVAYAESNEAGRSKSRSDAALIIFEHNTGPLVDDLVAAAREMLKFGEHESPCVRDSEGGCPRHIAMFQAREKALRARIAALDEAAP